jgi:F-type H+-transporting ATPase subunit delta
MATLGKVTNRYAKAFFEGLRESKDSASVLEDLESFRVAASAHKELTALFASPGFAESEKTQIVSDIASKMKLSSAASRILIGLSRMDRLTALTPILARLRVLLLENQGVQPIHVRTAEPLSVEDKRAVENKFEKVLGKKVEATYETNKELVGGLRVIAGGRTFDGSVLGWLETLKERLVEGEL